jgi:hypothetical protein
MWNDKKVEGLRYHFLQGCGVVQANFFILGFNYLFAIAGDEAPKAIAFNHSPTSLNLVEW